MTAWKTRNREYVRKYNRDWKLQKRYGLTRDQYDALMAQGCAICGGEADALDHCHATGRVRSPLCGLCNRGLGNFRDNPELLIRAVAYLREHKED